MCERIQIDVNYFTFMEECDKMSKLLENIRNLTFQSLMQEEDFYLKSLILKLLAVNIDLQIFYDKVEKIKKHNSSDINKKIAPVQDKNIDKEVQTEFLICVENIIETSTDNNQSLADAENSEIITPLSKEEFLQFLPKEEENWLNFDSQGLKDSEILLNHSYLRYSETDANVTKNETSTLPDIQLINDCEGKVDECVITKELKESPPPLLDSNCKVIRIIFPSNFYIQTSELSQGFVEMDEMLNRICSSKSLKKFKTKSDCFKAINKYCVCYMPKNGCYYRVEVISWFEDYDTLVLVSFVDYGFLESVEFSNLSVLDDCFYEFPKFVIKCHLEYLHPIGSTDNKKILFWPVEAIDHFKDYLGDISENTFKLYYVNPEHDPKKMNSLGVDFFSMNHDISVGQYLLNKDQAVEIIETRKELTFNNTFMKEQIKKSQGLSEINERMNDMEQLDVFFKTEIIEEHDNVNEAVINYDPKDEANICKFQNKNGTCFKGARCQKQHKILPKDGFTSDAEPVYIEFFNDIYLPPPDSIITIRITSIYNIQRFYVHIIGSGEAPEASYVDLIETMNNKTVLSKYQCYRGIPSMGEIIIAKHPENKKWHRARVLDVTFPDSNFSTLTVFFGDIGIELDISIKDIRKMEPDFMHLPFSAIQAQFSNVKHMEGADYITEVSYFKKYLNSLQSARVTACNNGSLELLMFDDRCRDIGKLLVKNGCGELKTESLLASSKAKYQVA